MAYGVSMLAAAVVNVHAVGLQSMLMDALPFAQAALGSLLARKACKVQRMTMLDMFMPATTMPMQENSMLYG
eukprot:12906659-Alexandrium_andersonii.AAC.1